MPLPFLTGVPHSSGSSNKGAPGYPPCNDGSSALFEVRDVVVSDLPIHTNPNQPWQSD